MEKIEICEFCKERQAITFYLLAEDLLQASWDFLNGNVLELRKCCLECAVCISTQLYGWDDDTINEYIKKEVEFNGKEAILKKI